MLFRSRKAPDSPAENPDSLKEALGTNLTPEEQAYLEGLETRLKGELDFEDPASVEAELRKREWEQLQKSYRPHAPLYGKGSYQATPGEAHAVKGNSGDPRDKNPQQKSYQNDPRYREYFERLRRETVHQPPNKYDEEVKPQSLDELDKTGWTSTPRPAASPTAPARSSRPVTPATAAPPRSSAPAYADEPEAGTIFRFDDGSVAVYKDAVSGKDYALFYFLEPSGAFVPRGIFLEQYERQKIGKLAPVLFGQMIERKRWDRDAVIFHLDDYSHAGCIPQLSSGSGGTGSGSTGTGSTTGSGARPATATGTGGVHTPREYRPATQPDVNDTRSGRSASGSSRRDALLERGRVLRVNVGGRVWESVYWTEDEIGPIVAHNTNKVWALMHLDLNRFRDSLEYGEVLSYEQLSEIEQSLASQS